MNSSDGSTDSAIVTNCSTPDQPLVLNRDEVAKRLGLPSEVGHFFETVKYNEEDPILIIDWKEMGRERKDMILRFMAERGAEVVHTCGTVVRFKDWKLFRSIQKELRKAHPRAFFSSCAETTYSREQTISTKVITFFSPSKFLYDEDQYFEV
ncbi:hypothetical protein ACQ4LE_003366 [Meloidogyne hapla]|uniref:NB-ARC domain-containing protein n=1 Tax=Meloidogyne hapla TaxID=6305 RepID=A0A1I8C150_MELHA